MAAPLLPLVSGFAVDVMRQSWRRAENICDEFLRMTGFRVIKL
jgi:hypothetical protein